MPIERMCVGKLGFTTVDNVHVACYEMDGEDEPRIIGTMAVIPGASGELEERFIELMTHVMQALVEDAIKDIDEIKDPKITFKADHKKH